MQGQNQVLRNRTYPEQMQEQVQTMSAEKERSEKERILAQAQLHGLRQQHGLITSEDDFTSKERFLELEAEFKAFEQLFETQWKYTKKRIWKEILGKRYKADKNEKDEGQVRDESGNMTELPEQVSVEKEKQINPIIPTQSASLEQESKGDPPQE